MNNCWNDFFATGSIAAYLAYIDDKTNDMEKKCQRSIETGDNPYAGFSNHNGNGNESSTYR